MLQLSNENTVIKFIEFCKGNGINNNGIAGLLGNLYAESGVRTNNLQNSYNTKFGLTDEEFTAAVDSGQFNFCDPDTKFGYGLAQWTSVGRRGGLYNYCKGKNVSIADEQAQFEWLLYELRTSYKAVYNELISSTNTVESCASIVVCKYEIPRSVLTSENSKRETVDKRTGYAQEFYDRYLREDDKMANKVVAINAGHWNGNPKGVPVQMAKLGNTREFTLNNLVVQEVVRMLGEYDGITVVQNYDVTGNDGNQATNGLTKRIEIAEKAKADIYLSVHHNAANTIFSGGGTVVYYYQGNVKNQASATKLYNEIKARTGLVGNRAVPVNGTRNLQEINDTSMPAFLIECAFMNSTVDIEYIAKPEWPTQVAGGIVAFLVSEFGLTKKVAEKVPETSVVEPVKEADVVVAITTKGTTEKITLGRGDKVTIERV